MKIYRYLTLIVLIAISLIAIHLLIEIIGFISNSSIRVSPILSATAGETISIDLPSVRKYDRIYLIFDGRVNVDEIYVSPISTTSLPSKVESFEHDVFPTLINEKRYLYIAGEDSESVSIHIRLQPLIPYIIKDIEGQHKYTIMTNCSKEKDLICIGLSPIRFHINNYSRIAFIYPFKQRAEPNFKVRGLVKLIHGHVDYVNVIVMTEKDWYTYQVIDIFTPPNTPILFDIDAYSVDISGRQAEFLGENIVAIAISVGVSKSTYENCSSLIVGIGELVIYNGKSIYEIKPTVQTTFAFNPRIYVFRKFKPSIDHRISILSLTTLLVSLTLLLTKIMRGDLN